MLEEAVTKALKLYYESFEADAKEKERQRQIVEWTAIIIGVGVCGSFLVWLVGLAMKAQGVL